MAIPVAAVAEAVLEEGINKSPDPTTNAVKATAICIDIVRVPTILATESFPTITEAISAPDNELHLQEVSVLQVSTR